ncbi:MAG: response regulator [Candidatus Aminicenantes bacterium]|nr:response regulator [Candidatus Aminicenantes bacterium]
MKKILIVDDQSEIRELVDITLRVSDYKILLAENGEEAIEIALQENPDLIIMDILMPGDIDGIEATRILKNNALTKDCPVIILTSKGQEKIKEKGFEAGADDYFVKPFSPLNLIQKVEEFLGV